jgi:GST-like protein
MELFWFDTTNPQKVRLALEELELPYTLTVIDLFKRENTTESYKALSPRGKVPVLRIDDAIVLWESGAALTWLGQNHAALWPKTSASQAQALNLLYLESAAFQDLAGAHFFNRVVLPKIGKPGDEQRVQKAAKKLSPLLTILAQQLGDKPYLFDTLTVVDCAYAPWLPVLDLEAFPTLMAWRKRLQERPAWKRCQFSYGDTRS